MGEKVSKYMIGTTAIHKMGDISREEGDLCYIHEIGKDYYVGNWVTGYGFIRVLFPKETTRGLTQEEKDYWNGRGVQIGSQPAFPLKVD